MGQIGLTMLGTGSPRPSLERAQSSQVMIIDGIPIMIDCGEGSSLQLLKAGIKPEEVKHLWFTHLHADHVLGYGQFLIGGWATGRSELTIYGPKGTKKFHERMIEMFEEDIHYRASLGRTTTGVHGVKIIEIERPGLVACDLPAIVMAESMVHNVPTFAYRFEAKDQTIVFSGDTAPTEKLVELSKGADILIHDACLANPVNGNNPAAFNKIYENLKGGHCSPGQAADTAQRAGVKTLVLTHFLDGVDEEAIYQEAAERFNGRVIVAKDLERILEDQLAFSD